MLRKLNIAIDCANDAQRDDVQKILEEVSAMRLLDGNAIVTAYPWMKAHRSELTQLFNLIAKDGVKAIVSVPGGTLIAKLMRK